MVFTGVPISDLRILLKRQEEVLKGNFCNFDISKCSCQEIFLGVMFHS